MTDLRAAWLEKAQSLLPSEAHVLERNARITAIYAELYLKHRDLFKWAGMAAFASYQVGTALKPLGLHLHPGPLRDDLELIRKTNNAVYRDIAWAHFAYQEAGIEELRRCLAGSRDDARLLEGFEHIDIGARTKPVSMDRVWRGNTVLLRHEQEHTVQPRFDQFDKLFDVALTCFTMLDFDADAEHLDTGTLSAFTLFMLTRGLHKLVLSCSLPNVADFRQRWYWIVKSLLPEWQKVDRSDPDLENKMQRFATGRARV
jgi:hypothetical protein